MRKIIIIYNFFDKQNLLEFNLKDKENNLYNKYYWYHKYKTKYFDLYGYDAGVEQEEYKILEEINEVLEGNINWNLIKQIEEDSL